MQHYLVISAAFKHQRLTKAVTSSSSDSELSHESDDAAISYIQEAEINPDPQRTESNTTPIDENNKLAWKVEFISSIMISWWIFVYAHTAKELGEFGV